MKQTNNAIKFLMAQYRAIFKQAYIKGLASAVILTAGLAAAGSANAEGTALTTLESGKDYVITGTDDADNKKNEYKNLNVTNNDGFTGNLTITGGYKYISGGPNNTITDVDINSSGNLTIDSDASHYGNSSYALVGVAISNSTGNKTVAFKNIELTEGKIAVNSTASGKDAGLTLDAEVINVGNADVEKKSELFVGAGKKEDSRASGSITIGHTADGDKDGTILNLTSKGTLRLKGSSGGTAIVGDELNMVDGSMIEVDTGYQSGGAIAYDNKAAIKSHEVNMDGGNLYVLNKSTLTLDLETKTDKQDNPTVGVFKANSGNILLTGNLNIQDGVLEINDNVNLASLQGYTETKSNGSWKFDENGAEADTTYVGHITLGAETTPDTGKGVLKLSEKKLTSFLTSQTIGDEKSAAGVVVMNGGVLEFTDKADIDVADFKYSSGDSAELTDLSTISGSINVVSGSTIKGANLTISHALTKDGKDVNSDTDNKKLADTAAQKLSFEADNLSLGNVNSDGSDIKFKSAQAKNVKFTAKGSNSFVLNNEIKLSSVTKDINGAIVADDGSIIGPVKISSTSGSLIVDGGNYTADDKISITNGGKLTVQNNTEGTKKQLTSSLTVSELEVIKSDSAAAVLVSGSGSSLDIDRLTVTDVKDSTASATFTASGGGVISFDADDIQKIINDGNKTAGISLTAASGGTIAVDGDINLTYKADNITQLEKLLHIEEDGTMSLANLTVKENLASDDTNFTFGGTLDLNSLKFSAYDADGIKADDSATIHGGIYKIKSSLGSDNKLLNLAGATNIELGYLDANDAVVGGGSVTTDLKLSENAVITVTGDWSAKNVELTAAGNKLNINENGSLKLGEFKASAGKLNVTGSAVIAGNSKDENTSGLSLAADSVFLTGDLTLGAGIAEDLTVKSVEGGASSISGAAGITAGAIDIKGGTLTVDFADGRTFSSADLKALKEHLFKTVDANGGIDGTLNIGKASIGSLDLGTADDNGRYDFSNVAGVADVTEGGVTNEELINNSFTTETGADLGGTIGSAHVTTGTTANISKTAGFVNSDTNNGFFVSAVGTDGKDTAADINFSGTKLNLENGGKAGDITLSGTDQTLTVKSSDKETVLGDVTGTDAVFNISGTAKTVAGDVAVKNMTLAQGSVMDVNSLSLTGSDQDDEISLEGDINVKTTAVFGTEANLTGTTVVGEKLTAGGNLGVYGDLTVQAENGKAVLDLAGNFEVGEGATVKADIIKLTGTGQTISVGEDAYTENGTTYEGTTGYLETSWLDLNGGILIIDPDYGKATSVGAVATFKDKYDAADAGIINGKVILGQNSALMVGKDASVAEMQKLIADYQQNGSLVDPDDDGVGAVLALNSKAVLSSGSQIILDPTLSKNQILGDTAAGITGAINSGKYENSGDAIELYMSKGSVLFIQDSVLNESGTDKIAGAIHFDTTDASIKGETDSKIVLGDAYLNTDNIVLFTDNGNAADAAGTVSDGVKVVGDAIRVETQNGLMYFTLSGDNVKGGSLELDPVAAKEAFLGVSAPVRESLLKYASKTANYGEVYEATTPAKKEVLLGDVAAGYTFENGSYKKGTTVLTTDEVAKLNLTHDANATGDAAKVVYYKAANEFLAAVTQKTDGTPADKAARLSAFGGTAQAAIAAGTTTYDAVAGRMGMGAAAGNITFADNGQGAGLWLAPVYKNHDSDGFGAQGVNYGVDMDLFGLALGGDFTLANGVRVGAALNVGSGDADGQGAGAGVSNDFDYVGFTVYGGYTVGQLSVVGDISYTTVDNDLSAATSVDRIKASADSSNLSVGVTGQYAFDFNGVSLAPHAGLRYSKIDMDDYRFSGEAFGDIGSYKGDSVSVFSVPVGVTVSKDIVAGAWTVKPAFDFTLTANMGDDAAEGTVYWDGISNMNTRVESEVIDSFTYGATLGVSAKTGNFGLGFGLSYTGSSNTDELGVNANARFVF